MLTVTLPATETFEAVTLNFEHSLVSLSKWEAIHEKAFFGKESKTPEETLSYLIQMLLNPDPPELFYNRFTVEDFTNFTDYINSRHTATTIREDPNQKPSRQIMTSEVIYSWMVDLQIPFEPCNSWHLNQLMTLITIRAMKNTKPKPMSKQAVAEQMRKLNAERRQALGTTG